MTNRLAIHSSENSHVETYAFPLSFAQQRLWFLQRLYPDSSTYNIPTALRLRGELDIKALQQSIDHLIERHEVLRTTFAIREGEAVQIVHPTLPVSIAKTDLGNIEASRREETLLGLIQFDARLPFDLERGPLLRVKLIQIADDEHVLVLNLHHIVSDGWSMDVIFRELSVIYQACRSGQPHALPELPIQYADYSVWQRNWLQGANLDQQLSYWRKQLDGLSTLQLPTDHPRPPAQTYRGSSQSMELSAELSQALKGLSQREGVTLYMTLLAAFQTLLYRYCGQQDIVVGSPIAGRTRQETEGLIGFLVNTLLLRADLSNNPSFRQLLTRVRQGALDAYDHQEIPFEKLVEELKPDRSLTTSPLFQVMFVLQNTGDASLRLEGLSAIPIPMPSNTAKFDLSLTISERQGTLPASFNYNTDLFDDSTIERMLGHFQTLLEGIVANPDQRIGELPLITEAEKHQLLVQWNDTKTDYPKGKCIHQLFESQVERTPEAVAVVFDDQQLSYRELNNRANQLARHLQKLGVGPEALVGICVKRSIEMIVGLLGILKAGGAYVPLDSSNPAERLRFVLEDTHVGTVLTDVVSLMNLPPTSASVICLDRDWEEISKQPRDNPDNQGTADNLAYVIYTSGTAGTPKGVMIDHRSLVNYLCWFNESPLRQSMKSLPVLTRASFDASLKQLFAPLLRAGHVWLLSDELVNQPTALPEALSTQSRVGLNCVPSLWRAVLDDLKLDRLTALRHSLSALLLGGEQLDQDLVDRTFSDMPDIEIWNLYGPTEATANACTGRVMPHSPPAIGRPIANTQVYILDRQLQLVPIGVPGELHIGGDGLARGYLNHPELTAEKFIANPFSPDLTSRLYKTGDLARYLPDGNIEYLGRIDNQVKIRGFRIELGEIEAVLAQHPSIQQAVVLAREDNSGDRRLVAYTVANEGSAPSSHDLRSHLQHTLPEYMVPSAYVFLESLPLTPNGKIDRKALPAPDQTRPELEDTFAAPRTPVEEILANIWCTVLKLDKVGIYDNFFQLGGHSLLATQVVARIRETVQFDLPLRCLFESPTIQGLAQKLEELRDHQAVTQTAQISRLERGHYRVQTMT
ncbi:MAG TPA: amino acid adenylation domain-containing protein [Candidatus Binatia bacterium]|nr:amino acid adenylation domain-containing protein [Candidatus Binatia bacterium]